MQQILTPYGGCDDTGDHDFCLQKPPESSKTERKTQNHRSFLGLFRKCLAVSQEEICEKLDMKPRTLREYIKDSRDVLLRACGAQVIQKSNRGYMIETDDRASLLAYLEKEKKTAAQQEYITPSAVRAGWTISSAHT